jgi:hypothetical protein
MIFMEREEQIDKCCEKFWFFNFEPEDFFWCLARINKVKLPG